MTQVLLGLSQLFTGHLGASVTRLPLGYITNGRLTLQGSLISPLTLTMALITSRTQTNESGGFRSSYFGRSVREVHLVNEHLSCVTSGEAPTWLPQVCQGGCKQALWQLCVVDVHAVTGKEVCHLIVNNAMACNSVGSCKMCCRCGKTLWAICKPAQASPKDCMPSV